MSKVTKYKNNLFSHTDNVGKELKVNAIRGSANSMAAEIGSFVLRAGSMIILARMLAPEDFGLIGMVTALTFVAERFMDLGLSTATIQKKVITCEQVSNLFWINVGVGGITMAIVASLSNAVAWFYGEHRLALITLALSVSFLLGGLTVQHKALMRRQMRFGTLGLIRIGAECLSIGTSIVLAWKGFGYWALVWKEVFRSLVLTVGSWVMCRWVPNRPRRVEGFASMLRFGGNVTGFNLIFFLSRSFDHILIGKVWGAVALGFYRQAYQLMSLSSSQVLLPINYVAEPTLSALQNDKERYRRSYERILVLVSFVIMPLAVFLAIFAEPLIHIVLGEKWIRSAPIFAVLAIGAFVQPIASTCGFVMVTCGKSGQYLRWGLLNAVSFLIAVSIGIIWGAIGVASAISLNAYLILVPSVWYGLKGTPVPYSMFFRSLVRAAVASVGMGVFLLGVRQIFFERGLFTGLALSCLVGFAFYLGLWLVLPGGKARLKEMFSYLQVLVGKSKTTS